MLLKTFPAIILRRKEGQSLFLKIYLRTRTTLRYWFSSMEGGCALDVGNWVMSPLLPGSQERQDKLREMGFVDILHKLSQASDTNLSDRWATAAHNKARRLVKQDTLRVHVCMCLAGRAKTAMQQYLAWPWWRRRVIRKTWLVLPLLSLVLLCKGTICGPVVGRPSPPPLPT